MNERIHMKRLGKIGAMFGAYVLAISLGAILVASLVLGYLHHHPSSTHYGKGRDNQFMMTTSYLANANALAASAHARTGDAIPIEASGLIEWLAASERGIEVYMLATLPYVSEDGTRLLDGWGESVIIIAHDGEFYGLASRGANRRWEDGRGDDVVMPLHDIRVQRRLE